MCLTHPKMFNCYKVAWFYGVIDLEVTVGRFDGKVKRLMRISRQR
jgi:hypothetical protein